MNRKNKIVEILIVVVKLRLDMIVNLVYSKGFVVIFVIGVVVKLIYDYVIWLYFWLYFMVNWIIFVWYFFSVILFFCRNVEKMIIIFLYNEKFSNIIFKSYFRENY